MEIVSGRTGKPHVTSQQFRQILEGIVGDESYILASGENLEPELTSNNALKIRSGMMYHHGNVSSVKIGTYDEVELTNGTQGMKRIDLVVNRYTRNGKDETEKNEWIVIMGTPAESNPAVPGYTQGNLQEGDLVDDCPVFEVHFDGINIVKVTKRLEIAKTNKDLTDKLSNATTNVDILKSNNQSGRALKIYEATENLAYGCWNEGIYNYGRYYGNGAPSDWAGTMRTYPLKDTSGKIDGFVKIAWSAECKTYMMRQSADGTIEQAWVEE